MPIAELISGRVWFAVAAGAVLLAGVVYLPPWLRPGVPVSQFPQLPDPVARDLNRRNCNIVKGGNVISAEFAWAGKVDWAVLCQQDDRASLLIYLAGSSQPSIHGTHGAGLVDDPEVARHIRVVHWDYVVRHNPGLDAVAVQPACIEDAAGMGSLIYCYLNNAWTALPGAD